MAIFNALIASIMFNARLFFSLGRDEIFHPTVNSVLAGVHRSSGAPRAATWAVGVIAAACCLLDTHVLVVFLSGLTVHSLGLVSVAVLVGRRWLLTGQPGYLAITAISVGAGSGPDPGGCVWCRGPA